MVKKIRLDHEDSVLYQARRDQFSTESKKKYSQFTVDWKFFRPTEYQILLVSGVTNQFNRNNRIKCKKNGEKRFLRKNTENANVNEWV